MRAGGEAEGGSGWDGLGGLGEGGAVAEGLAAVEVEEFTPPRSVVEVDLGELPHGGVAVDGDGGPGRDLVDVAALDCVAGRRRGLGLRGGRGGGSQRGSDGAGADAPTEPRRSPT